jgi:hypothetical protein
MKRILALAGALLLAACATGPDPFDDVARVQRSFDERGIGFGVTRVPGHDAFVFQVRFSASDSASELNTDPMAAAEAAAPEGCTVKSLTHQADGAVRADYECLPTRSANSGVWPTAVHNPN